MTYRPLGRSGLKVSPLCLGTMMFGGATEEAAASRIVDRARDDALVDRLVTPGHASTPGYNDWAYPLEGRATRVD